MASEPKKRKIAERDYLDADNNVVDEEHEAAGVRYTQLRTGNVYDSMTGAADHDIVGTRVAMLAAFGLKTLIGNLVSQFDGDLTAVRERDEQIVDGQPWPGRQGGEGSRIDLDVLAQALLDEATAQGAVAGSPDDFKATMREKAEDLDWARARRNDPRIAPRYVALAAKGKPVENLFG